jgi:hypothetical protein
MVIFKTKLIGYLYCITVDNDNNDDEDKKFIMSLVAVMYSLREHSSISSTFYFNKDNFYEIKSEYRSWKINQILDK